MTDKLSNVLLANDEVKFQVIANRVIGIEANNRLSSRSNVGEIVLSAPNQNTIDRVLEACEAMDDALSQTIIYLQKRKSGQPENSSEEQRLSQLWITASQKISPFDPELAEATHFKGMGWLDPEAWERAKGDGIKTSIEDMQKARQTLNNIVFEEERKMGSQLERILVFAFGVVFVSVLLGVALFLPDPTDFQYTIIRIILALAAAGVAALIPGFISARIGRAVSAGGAMAVFAIVFFFSPASIVTNSASNANSNLEIVEEAPSK